MIEKELTPDMSLKIPGIEGQDDARSKETSDASQERIASSESAQTSPQQPRLEMQSKPQDSAKKSKSLAGVFSPAALVLSVAALGYAFALQREVNVLKFQLGKAQATADSALKTAKSVPVPRDFMPDIARVEATVISKFRVTDEFLQKTIPEEIRKISAMESRLTTENRETSNSLASATQTVQQLRQSSQKIEERFSNIITILRNQDKVLRRLVQKEISDAQ